MLLIITVTYPTNAATVFTKPEGSEFIWSISFVLEVYVCMYVCMYVCIYVGMYVCLYIYI